MIYARKLALRLKTNKTREDLAKVLSSEVIPMLRKQEGFRDGISFFGQQDGSQEAIAISLWDKKESAERFGRDIFPKVWEKLETVVEGKPDVRLYEVTNSTIHGMQVGATA